MASGYAGYGTMMNGVDAIRAVLFDFGGVLAEEGFREGLYAIARDNGLDGDAFLQAGREAVYATGYVTVQGTEADFWAALRGGFPLGGSDEALSALILERFVLRPAMLAAVEVLRKEGIVCGILSDQTDWLERLERRDGFFGHFDRIYNSYRQGRSKRDADLFDAVVADLGLEPGEVVFLDDDAGHVARARSRGLQAIRCDSAPGCLIALEELLGIPAREAE